MFSISRVYIHQNIQPMACVRACAHTRHIFAEIYHHWVHLSSTKLSVAHWSSRILSGICCDKSIFLYDNNWIKTNLTQEILGSAVDLETVPP